MKIAPAKIAPVKIACRELTVCEVAPDGQTVAFGMIDASGQEAAVTMALDDVGSLAMTLPGLVQQAMRTRYRDPSLRYAYPVGSWTLERSSEASTFIMTFRTPDGFTVSFSMPKAICEELAVDLSAADLSATDQAGRRGLSN